MYHKTIIYSVSIVCTSVLLGFAMHVFTRPAGSHVIQDKFTNCVQIIMSESRQSGKVIDAKEASDLCKNVHFKG